MTRPLTFDEIGERVAAERSAQGLPRYISDPEVLHRFGTIMRELLVKAQAASDPAT